MAKAEATKVSNTKRPATAAKEGDKTPAAPRPRKHDYGIVGANKVRAVKQENEPKLKAKEAEGYAMAVKGCTVEQFLAADPGNRGILRRLSRKGLVQVVGADGTVYPKEYTGPAPKAKGKAA